uniref:Ribosomal_L7Ae domain-containing protein n=1 Tax=Trichuris muris TaxID=70415 RepID=A0A5S6QTT9_TRIMR
MTHCPQRGERRKPRIGDPLLASECLEIISASSLRSRKASRGNVVKETPPLLKPNPLDSSNPLVCQHRQNRKGKVSVLKKAILKERDALNTQSVRPTSAIIQLMDNQPSKSLDNALGQLLVRLKEFHDRAYQRGLTKVGKGKRLVCGLHETRKYVDLNKAKLVIIARDLEDSIFNVVQSLLNSCKEREIPYVFALSRLTLGKAVFKKAPIASVAVLTYHDAQDLYKLVADEMAASKKAHEDAKTACPEGDALAEATVTSQVMEKMESLKLNSGP